MKDRIRRSRLYMPGNNPYLSQNAFLFDTDVIILDLEDAVPPAEKFASRILVREILQTVDFGSAEKAVRINPISTPFGRRDLEEVIPAKPELVFIPKAESRDDIEVVDEIIAGVKHKHKLDCNIYYAPIIESAKGVWNAYDIASASENVVMLAFGAEDFTKDIGAARSREGREQFVARSMVVLGAKAAGVLASDTVWSDLEDVEGLTNSAQEARELGFDGKGAIHPAQTELINKIFSPSEEEIANARAIVTAFNEATARGSSVIALGRKMIDPPVVARAQRILALAEKLLK